MQFLDAFYMDKGNIGEFAKGKISELIDCIDNIQTRDSEKMRELCYLAGSVGDSMARRELLNKVFTKNSQNASFMEQWEQSSDEERRKILEYMKNLRHTED